MTKPSQVSPFDSAADDFRSGEVLAASVRGGEMAGSEQEQGWCARHRRERETRLRTNLYSGSHAPASHRKIEE